MLVLPSYRRPFRASTNLAEVVGFEPTEQLPAQLISNQPPSATQPHFLFLAPQPGLEPGTHRLTVCCSTN